LISIPPGIKFEMTTKKMKRQRPQARAGLRAGVRRNGGRGSQGAANTKGRPDNRKARLDWDEEIESSDDEDISDGEVDGIQEEEDEEVQETAEQKRKR
jgi:hypothetical protein